jgi:hypothetical protein
MMTLRGHAAPFRTEHLTGVPTIRISLFLLRLP